MKTSEFQDTHIILKVPLCVYTVMLFHTCVLTHTCTHGAASSECDACLPHPEYPWCVNGNSRSTPCTAEQHCQGRQVECPLTPTAAQSSGQIEVWTWLLRPPWTLSGPLSGGVLLLQPDSSTCGEHALSPHSMRWRDKLCRAQESWGRPCRNPICWRVVRVDTEGHL